MSETQMTVAELSEKTGISAPAIYKYLTGERKPKWAFAERIKKATHKNVTLDDFYKTPKSPKRAPQPATRGGRECQGANEQGVVS